MSEPWYLSALACPDCGEEITANAGNLHCRCGFSSSRRSPIDLRPQHPRPRPLEMAIRSSARSEIGSLDVSKPRITYGGPAAFRDSSELFSAAQPWLAPGCRLLDLGCGPRDQAVPAKHLALEYVGVDFDSSQADALADGHCIPFQTGTFDAVLAYAVLEHLYAPAVALREIARVLRPGAIFFGAVSQGEPFHNSYFHHTSWGVLAAFDDAGLQTLRLWPSYDTLHSLAVMGRYARVIRTLLEVVHRIDRAAPFLAPRTFFRATARQKQLESLYRAASVCFVARKPETR